MGAGTQQLLTPEEAFEAFREFIHRFGDENGVLVGVSETVYCADCERSVDVTAERTCSRCGGVGVDRFEANPMKRGDLT